MGEEKDDTEKVKGEGENSSPRVYNLSIGRRACAEGRRAREREQVRAAEGESAQVPLL